MAAVSCSAVRSAAARASGVSALEPGSAAALAGVGVPARAVVRCGRSARVDQLVASGAGWTGWAGAWVPRSLRPFTNLTISSTGRMKAWKNIRYSPPSKMKPR